MMCVKNLFAIAVSIMFCSWVVMMWARSSLFRPDKFKVVNSTSDTTKVLKTDLMFIVEVTPIVLTKNFWGYFISLCSHFLAYSHSRISYLILSRWQKSRLPLLSLRCIPLPSQ